MSSNWKLSCQNQVALIVRQHRVLEGTKQVSCHVHVACFFCEKGITHKPTNVESVTEKQTAAVDRQRFKSAIRCDKLSSHKRYTYQIPSVVYSQRMKDVAST